MKKLIIILIILSVSIPALAWDAEQWRYQQQQNQYQQRQLEIQQQQLEEQRRLRRQQEQQYYNDQLRQQDNRPYNYKINSPNLLDAFNKGREDAHRDRNSWGN